MIQRGAFFAQRKTVDEMKVDEFYSIRYYKYFSLNYLQPHEKAPYTTAYGVMILFKYEEGIKIRSYFIYIERIQL